MDIVGPGSPAFSKLIDGSFADEAYFTHSFGNVNNPTITFDFGTAKIIDEAKWYQSGADTHGNWKWRRSSDNVSYTDVGVDFALGGSTLQTHTELNGNTTAARYWQLYGVSGSITWLVYLEEIEFKQD